MTPLLMLTWSPERLPDSAVQHAERWCRLQEERRFRLEQLAALDAERSEDGLHHSVKLALRSAASTALHEIEGALTRMVCGRYGLCVDCAQPIPDHRLDVLPMAPLCMACHFNQQNCDVATGREARVSGES